MESEQMNSVEEAITEIARDRCSPELEAQYIKMGYVLQECNVNFHLDELDLLWATMNDLTIDSSEIIPWLDRIMRASGHRALNICGVVLEDQIDFAMLIEACDILLNFDPTDTPQVVLDMLDNCEDDEESLGRLLAQMGTVDELDWYPQIVSVSPSYVTNVRKVVKKEVDLVEGREDTPEGNAEQLKRLSRLTRLSKNSLGAELGAINAGIGASMESLYGCHVDKLLDLSTEKQVEELFGLACISNESFESAMVAIDESLDDLITDMNQRRQATVMKKTFIDIYRPIFGE